MTTTTANLTAFKQSVKAGDVLRCVENTYVPHRVGQRLHITKAGPTVCQGEMDGQGFRLEWPKRVSDVLEATETSITYRIGRGDHTATWAKDGVA